jgi:hypothetical protein
VRLRYGCPGTGGSATQCTGFALGIVQEGPPFRHRSAEMDSLLHWIGVAVALLIVALGLVGFWRGLSIKPTDPANRPSEGFWRRSPWEWF